MLLFVCLEGQEKELIHLSIGDMSHTMLSTEEMMTRVGKMVGSKVSGATSSVVHRSVSPNPDNRVEKRPRPVLSRVTDDDVHVMIPKSTCVYDNPSSVLGYVDQLLSPLDKIKLDGKTSKERSHEMVEDTYKVLSTALYIGQDYQRLDKELRAKTKSYEDLKSKKVKVEEEARASKDELEKCKLKIVDLELELTEEKDKSAKLVSELDDISIRAVVRTRGELMMDYRDGKIAGGPLIET